MTVAQNVRNRWCLPIAWVLAFLLVGCQSTPVVVNTAVQSASADEVPWRPDMRLMALDFVQAIMQIDPLMTRRLPFAVQGSDFQFDQALSKAMADVGMALQSDTTANATARNTLFANHNVMFSDPSPDTNGAPLTVSVNLSVDSVSLQRRYRAESGRLLPDSAFMIRGYDPSSMRVSNDLFDLDYNSGVAILSTQYRRQHGQVFDRLPASKGAPR